MGVGESRREGKRESGRISEERSHLNDLRTLNQLTPSDLESFRFPLSPELSS